MRVNSVSLGSAVWTFAPASSSGFYVSGNSGGNIYASADYGRVILITQALDATTVRGIEDYLTSYFGVS